MKKYHFLPLPYVFDNLILEKHVFALYCADSVGFMLTEGEEDDE